MPAVCEELEMSRGEMASDAFEALFIGHLSIKTHQKSLFQPELALQFEWPETERFGFCIGHLSAGVLRASPF